MDTCQKDHLVILDKSISTMSKLTNDLFDQAYGGIFDW